MGPAHNYLQCLLPGKGILKGRGKKESFYHVLQKLYEAICRYSVSLPAVLLLLFSPQSLEPWTWKEVLSFVSLGNSVFFAKVTALGQWHSKSWEHLCPWMNKEGTGAVIGTENTASASVLSKTFSVKKPVSNNFLIQYLPETFSLIKPAHHVILNVQVEKLLWRPPFSWPASYCKAQLKPSISI